MIITVTLNPALDKTADLEILQVGELNRLQNVVVDAGGKGINVSKMINALGGKSIATGFIGGGSGKELIDALNKQSITNDFVIVSNPTRTNLKVLDESGLTELNEPGPVISENELNSLIEKINKYANIDSIFVFSGSLPKGIDTNIYAKLIDIVHKNGGLAFLDADGAAFKAALPKKPDFIKPNLHELKEYFGVSGDLSLEEIANLCKRFLNDGIKQMALTMGGDGAMFLNSQESLFAPVLKVDVESSVGAGDSFVGAFAYALEKKMSSQESFSLAMAASAGAVTTVGTNPPSKDVVDNLLTKVKFANIK